eukprot:gene282-404_t
MFSDFGELSNLLPGIIKKAKTYLVDTNYKEPVNVLHIGFSKHSEDLSEDKLAIQLQNSLVEYKKQLTSMQCRMVNFLHIEPSQQKSKRVGYFNFYSETGFAEDPISRNMRPTMPLLLELNRLAKNHDLVKLPTVGRNAQLYLGVERGGGTEKKSRDSMQQVLFLRSISLSFDSVTPDGAERIILMALDEIERALLDPRITDTASTRMFVNMIPDIDMDVTQCIEQFEKIIAAMISKYATRLLKLRVDEIEVKIRVKESNGGQGYIPVRLIASSFTGGWLTREAYREYLDPVTGQTLQYCTLKGDTNVCMLDPYPTSNVLQKKRATARKVGSTYAPDFLGLIEVAIINSWQKYFETTGSLTASPPSSVFAFDELVQGKDGQLSRTKRFPGSNRIGMLAWHTTFKTPQYPSGREVVIIAND